MGRTVVGGSVEFGEVLKSVEEHWVVVGGGSGEEGCVGEGVEQVCTCLCV